MASQYRTCHGNTFSSGSLSERIALPVSLLGSISTNFTTLSASFVIAIAVLFGNKFGNDDFFIRHRISSVRQSGAATGFIGTVSGMLESDAPMRFHSPHDGFGLGWSGSTDTTATSPRRRIRYYRSNSSRYIHLSYR